MEWELDQQGPEVKEKKDCVAESMCTSVSFSKCFLFIDPTSYSLECVLCSNPWNVIQEEFAHLIFPKE